MLKMINIIVILVITCIFLSNPVHAEDSEHKKNLNAKSKDLGMAVPKVELLYVADGPGRDSILENVLADGSESLTLSNTRVYDVKDEGEYTNVTGDGWHMTIWKDGTKVEMMNYVGFEKIKREIKDKKTKFRNAKISQKRLEQIGIKFIKNTLDKYLPLEDNEEIVPFHSSYELDGEIDTMGNVTEEVVGNTIVYSRTIDGIDVVGAGSKISIIFANDETPIGFRFDWPRYEKTDLYQNVVSFDTAKERLASLSTMKEDSKNVNQTRMECGYFDPGITLRDKDAFVQSACYSFYAGQIIENDGISRVPHADVIPMGESVEEDLNWPAVNKLKNHGDVCEETDVSTIFVN